MNCPIKIPKVMRICGVCMFNKEGECDYPYYKNMREEEIKKLSKSLGGRG